MNKTTICEGCGKNLPKGEIYTTMPDGYLTLCFCSPECFKKWRRNNRKTEEDEWLNMER